MSKSNSYLKIAAGIFICLSSWSFAKESLNTTTLLEDGHYVTRTRKGEKVETPTKIWQPTHYVTVMCNADLPVPCGTESSAYLIWLFCWVFGLSSVGLGVYEHFRCCKSACKCCNTGCKTDPEPAAKKA